MTALIVSLRKELLLQWRSRARLLALVVFALMTLLLFSFAAGPDAAHLRKNAGGFLFIALLIASTLSLSESFSFETEQRAIEGTLLLPVSARSIFYAKALVTTLQLLVVGLTLVPFVIVFYDAPVSDAGTLCLVIALGAAGLAAPGTLYAAMTSGTEARQTLLPLLLFPLVVPVLIAGARSTSLIITGDPMRQSGSWILLLAAFNAIYWATCGLLVGRVMEE